MGASEIYSELGLTEAGMRNIDLSQILHCTKFRYTMRPKYEYQYFCLHFSVFCFAVAYINKVSSSLHILC